MTLKYKVGEVLAEKLQSPGQREDRGRKGLFNAQDSFLNQVRRERVEVDVRFLSGETLRGRIVGFDNFSILLDNSGQLLVYKHSVATITPVGRRAAGDGRGTGAPSSSPAEPATTGEGKGSGGRGPGSRERGQTPHEVDPGADPPGEGVSGWGVL